MCGKVWLQSRCRGLYHASTRFVSSCSSRPGKISDVLDTWFRPRPYWREHGPRKLGSTCGNSCRGILRLTKHAHLQQTPVRDRCIDLVASLRLGTDAAMHSRASVEGRGSPNIADSPPPHPRNGQMQFHVWLCYGTGTSRPGSVSVQARRDNSVLALWMTLRCIKQHFDPPKHLLPSTEVISTANRGRRPGYRLQKPSACIQSNLANATLERDRIHLRSRQASTCTMRTNVARKSGTGVKLGRGNYPRDWREMQEPTKVRGVKFGCEITSPDIAP